VVFGEILTNKEVQTGTDLFYGGNKAGTVGVGCWWLEWSTPCDMNSGQAHVTIVNFHHFFAVQSLQR
jgi:hypothetical protein